MLCLSICVLQSATMSGQSPFELVQNGERRVTLHYLGYGRVLLCAARDYDLSRPNEGINLTPFGVIFDTNLMVRLQTGYTLLVTSAAGSYIQVHTNVVIGTGVSLTLYLALNGRSALQPRAYREQPLAVVSLMESTPRPDMPIQTLINLDDDDDDDAGEGHSGAAAPPPSLLQTPAETPEPPATLVPETEDEAEDGPASGSATLEAAVPSSDPEERAVEEEELQGAVGGTEEEGSDSSQSGLWTGGESDSEETDSEAADSEGGDGEDDEVLGGDPLQGSAGNMGVRHRAGLFMFVLRAGDEEVPFPPNRGFPMRRLVREIELQLSEDARNIAWQSSVDCSCCPFDCIFFRGHWRRDGDSVVLTLAVASHMFSNIPTMNMYDIVRLVVEHRAMVIFGGPISVTGEAL